MLLNLSNHPSPSWPSAQIEAALAQYGAVEDMSFPAIDPHADAEQLQALVQEYYDKVVERRPAAVHLMGEMTFTFALVNRLREAGIPCVAATSERIATEEGGKKVVEFRFVRFRPYG